MASALSFDVYNHGESTCAAYSYLDICNRDMADRVNQQRYSVAARWDWLISDELIAV
jgi:hypothetical protein